MKLPKIKKEFFGAYFNALLLTLSIAATCHLALVIAMAIKERNISYVNPLDFLGVSILLPQYRDSTSVAILGWIVLIAFYLTILFIRARYHIYLALIREHPIHRHLTKTTEKIKKTVLEKLPQVPDYTHNQRKR
jgi:hypothetical protein